MPAKKSKTILILLIVFIALGILIWQLAKDRGPRLPSEKEIQEAVQKGTAPERELTPAEQETINKAIKSGTAPLTAPTESESPPELPGRKSRSPSSAPQTLPQDMLELFTAPEK